MKPTQSKINQDDNNHKWNKSKAQKGDIEHMLSGHFKGKKMRDNL